MTLRERNKTLIDDLEGHDPNEGGENMDYVPVLKWKSGEQNALGALDEKDKERIMPLIEILQDEEDGDLPLLNGVKRIEKYWGLSPFFLDVTSYVNISSDTNIESHPYTISSKVASEHDLTPVLVATLSLDRVGIQVLKAVLSGKSWNVALRLTEDDLESDQLKDLLDDFIESLETKKNKIFIILDFQDIGNRTQKSHARTVLSYIDEFPYWDKWKEVIITGTSFPESLQGFEKGITALPRVNWLAWIIACEKLMERDMRKPIFSDYGICGVFPPPTYQPYMVMSANIRYTADDNWLIFRGHSVKKEGFEQFHYLCEKITEHDAYKGERFSSGDKHIAKCAKMECGPGNATTWRTVGTSHHIALVLEQLANLP